jgi:hypothetical protein
MTDREANVFAMTDREANELVDRFIAGENAWQASQRGMQRRVLLTGRQAVAALFFWIAIALLPAAIKACLSLWPVSPTANRPTNSPAATASHWSEWMTPADVVDMDEGLEMSFNRSMAEVWEELDATLKLIRDRCNTTSPRYDAWKAREYCR